MSKISRNKAFTLIELLVVVSIIGLLATVVLSSLNKARIKTRDTVRLSELRQLRNALDLYFNQFGVYPDPASDGAPFACGGWDATADGSFIPSLSANNLFAITIQDTLNTSCGNYSYYRYPAGSYGCDASKGAFYILGVRDMETSSNPYSGSPGFNCSGRDWQGEFDWIVGKYEQS